MSLSAIRVEGILITKIRMNIEVDRKQYKGRLKKLDIPKII